MSIVSALTVRCFKRLAAPLRHPSHALSNELMRLRHCSRRFISMSLSDSIIWSLLASPWLPQRTVSRDRSRSFMTFFLLCVLAQQVG